MKQAQVMTWAAVMSAALTLGGCVGAQSSEDYQGVDEPLENTYWKLVALEDQPTPVVDGKREAHIVLHTQDSRVAGSTGCNRLMGEYHHDEQALGFDRLATTRMACPGEVATLERDFLATLNEVSGWQIDGKTLTLTDEQGASLARLEAVHLY
ncbi:META domain-containing protein [Cobetia amphilecti]|uniref:META domain-containing protein n=1 Tax=Cobetia amphilecti TaxID=1055104 RepID=A0AAP4TVX3_9GAMM|nr:META domain-containing protein [Cobetia amphilecti]MDO6671357.1 META domain-containing protein [Cobetia amphilecti]